MVKTLQNFWNPMEWNFLQNGRNLISFVTIQKYLHVKLNNQVIKLQNVNLNVLGSCMQSSCLVIVIEAKKVRKRVSRPKE